MSAATVRGWVRDSLVRTSIRGGIASGPIRPRVLAARPLPLSSSITRWISSGIATLASCGPICPRAKAAKPRTFLSVSSRNAWMRAGIAGFAVVFSSPRAWAASIRTIPFESLLRAWMRTGMASVAAGHISPRVRAAVARTPRSGSALSTCMRLGIAALAAGPLRLRASAASRRTFGSCDFSLSIWSETSESLRLCAQLAIAIARQITRSATSCEENFVQTIFRGLRIPITYQFSPERLVVSDSTTSSFERLEHIRFKAALRSDSCPQEVWQKWELAVLSEPENFHHVMTIYRLSTTTSTGSEGDA